jgi:predicted DNA-binding transcriptional regulator YafY
MSRTARLLELLITLQSRPVFTVAELAEEFGVSRRTMLRDLHALSEMGVPLAATPGPGGGFRLITGRRLLPLSLSVDEAVGLVLSYEAFLQYAQSPFAAQSLSAITKLRQAMPADVVRELDRLRAVVAVDEPPRAYQAPFLGELLQAALDGVHLDITYDSATGVSTRRIFPYGLYAGQGFWYCACHDYRRGEHVGLRADRVLSLTRVEGLPPPGTLTLREWLAGYRRGAIRMLPLRARLSRRAARSFDLVSVFSEVAVDADGRGVLETEIPAAELDWFANRFLPLGNEVEILSPPELVTMLEEKARVLAEHYRTGDL